MKHAKHLSWMDTVMTGEHVTAKPLRSAPMDQQLQEQLQLATSSASPLLPGKVSPKTGVLKDTVAASEDYAFSLKN